MANELSGAERIRVLRDEGRLVRGEYGHVEDGREMLCLLTGWVGDIYARPWMCHAGDAPDWLLSAMPWIDDAGTKDAWPRHIDRLVAVGGRFGSFSVDTWERISRDWRIAIVEEAVSNVTVDIWGVRWACADVISALQTGNGIKEAASEAWAAASVAAGAAAAEARAAAAWAAAARARAAARAAAWAAEARAAAAAEAAAWAAEVAAGAAAGAEAWAEARAAADRMISKLLDIMEAAK